MKQIVNTEFGTFRVFVQDDTDINMMTRRSIKKGISISVGGLKDTCVYITAPDVGTIAQFHNVKTRRLTCEVAGSRLGGEKTVGMINLAFTILSEKAPHITHVDLDDNSEFPCELSDGRNIGISLTLYELAFHQATWYERHFGAVLKNAALRAIYENGKRGFLLPKPDTYDFKHETLNAELGPIYASTSTWTEFFNILYTMDGKCKLMIPWYKHAIKMIMGGDVSFTEHVWQIELNKTSKVSYLVLNMGGSRTYNTRKKNRIMAYDGYYDYIDDMSEIKYTPHDFIQFPKNKLSKN